MGTGYLQVNLFIGDHVLPVKGSIVIIQDKNGNILHELKADENGITPKVALDTRDKSISLDPYSTELAFATYDVVVPFSNGYKKVIVRDVEIFDTITTILPVHLHPAIIGDTPEQNTDEINIPLIHGINDPLSKSRVTDLDYYDQDSIEMHQRILANEVVIPQYITVHLGSPNASARDVRIPFIDYIKNVASSEIFPTWHESALYANIYAQISFALNRVYTVWYRSRNFNFDITNSTAFDQFFVEGRDIFANISRIVDGIFNNFIRRQGRREPFFASYCNGTTSTCDGLSQWGSQELALRGYTSMQILRNYYPSDIQIVESTNFTGDVGSFSGTPLQEGSSGDDVLRMQRYLNRISGNFYIPSIPNPNGFFGSATKTTVTEFQRINNLIPDGIIGKSTWYAITKIYVAVAQLAELTSEGERISVGPVPPTITLQIGARGEYVVELQFLLNFIADFFPSIPFVIQDAVFRDSTKRSVTEFQSTFGLTPDGVVGPRTWEKLYDVYHSIRGAIELPPTVTRPPFPGTALRVGSQGENVRIMQNYLNAIAAIHPSIPIVTADGIFGPATEQAVIAFQRLNGLTPDGIIGQITWNRIVDVYSGLTPIPPKPEFPGTALQIGSRGSEVSFMQGYLNIIAKVFPVIPTLTVDGIFGAGTQTAVIAFQRLFGLTPDGVIGRVTWDKIVNIHNTLPAVSAPPYPGTALRVGSRGNDVTIMQKYLTALANQYPSIPRLTADGIFGSATEQAVIAFQKLFGLAADGVIGATTWNQIVSAYNKMLLSTASVYSTVSIGHRNESFDMRGMLLAFMLLRRF